MGFIPATTATLASASHPSRDTCKPDSVAPQMWGWRPSI